MGFFSKEEIKVVSIILFFVISVSLYNFKLATRRARDSQRIADTKLIGNLLDTFKDDLGFFPLSSENGKVLACTGGDFRANYKKTLNVDTKLSLINILTSCAWGVDVLKDPRDDYEKIYIDRLPGDPKEGQGISYRYLSNGKRFQLFAYLEGEESEDQFSEVVFNRNLSCGSKICNFGYAYGKTPLDKTIEEYENELDAKQK